MTEMPRPQAHVSKREVTRANVGNRDIRDHIGTEIVRSAQCARGKTTSNFVGVNSNGWVFRCSGDDRHDAHAFVASPPSSG